MESRIELIDRIDGKIDALDSRIANLGLAVRRLDAARSIIERLLAGVECASGELYALSAEHVTLKERLQRLETSISVVGSYL